MYMTIPWIKDGEKVLFIGDSVTDCGRSRSANSKDLGAGYPMFIASFVKAMYPEKDITFINRGISGNRTRDLMKRWKEDCIDLNPDWVSILIGINDTWRRYDSNDPMTVEEFESNYRSLLERTNTETNARLILMEPFVLPYPEDRKQWRTDLDPKIQAVRNLAMEYKAVLIPLDGLLASAAAKSNPPVWSEDGVHPTQKGHAFIAIEWMKALGLWKG
jgi:acyl-CoA thioesterase-1